MAISQALLPEFDQEMANTRKTLERVPDGKFDWKPHQKSGTMGWLAGHVANLPSWPTYILGGDSLDINPVGQAPPKPAAITSNKDLLATFDKNQRESRQALASASDQDLMKPWSLLSGGKTIFTMPKVAVLRSFLMNHIIHHRAQLTVYLRLVDVPVPALYGPSADEGGF